MPSATTDDLQNKSLEPASRAAGQRGEEEQNTGRPAGSSGFVAAMEALTGRLPHRQKPSPKRSQGTR